MNLNGSQQGKLGEALRDAFSPTDLRMVLFFRLDKRLDDYAMGDDFQQIVFRLIFKVNQEGWIDKMLEVALEERPHNDLLQRFAQSVNQPEKSSNQLLPVSSTDASSLEKIVNKEQHFVDFNEFLERFRSLGQWVCRIVVPGSGGTGFLVGPDLVLTNYHVIENILKAGGDIGAIRCQFDYKRVNETLAIDPGREVAIDASMTPPTRSYSAGDLTVPATEPTPTELDYALIRLSEKVADQPVGSSPQPGATPRGFLKLKEYSDPPGEGSTVIIFQHPKPAGGQQMPLQVAIGNVLPCGWNSVRLRYDANTLEGSSGSPVFNSALKFVGLHHAGDPDWQPAFNQAIPGAAVIRDFNNRTQELKTAGISEFWT